MHIPGRLNTGADEKSRVFSDNHEWMLNKQSFEEILLRHPSLDFDLFASRLNYQISSCCSWQADPNSAHVEEFTMNWNGHKFYAFPPFGLLPRCLQKISRDRAQGVVIAPLWPTQTWFPVLLQQLCDHALDPAPTTRPFTTPLPQWPTSTTQESSSDGMSCVRGSFSHYHFPEEVTDILMASWRKGTKKQYAICVKKWKAFCRERKINCYSPPLSDALNFSWGYLIKGLATQPLILLSLRYLSLLR